MTAAQRRANARYRRRLARNGNVRVEVHVHKDDAELVREVARALADPEFADALDRILAKFSPAKGFKAFLASAPLEGIDLEWPSGRDKTRDIEL